MNLTITWKDKTGQYENGERAVLGNRPVAVGEWNWRATRPKDDPHCYAASCSLPGLKPLDNYTTESQAKAAVQRAVATWFKNATGLDCTVTSG